MIFQKIARSISLLVALLFAAPLASFAQFAISISVHTAPPPLPVYVQPPLPAEGYIWTPGYWAYSEDGGYYWVPGVWVQPPTVGVLWTPAWWGYDGGVYGFHAGYWGPHVGYYGGINYGFGYGGNGFGGGQWQGGRFSYNSAVNNFGGVHVTNVYVNRTVINNTTIVSNHASFNGPGGYNARPTGQEQQFAHEQHIQPTTQQQQHFQTAAATPAQRFSANAGRPAVTAAVSPAAFHQQAARLPANPAGANRGATPGNMNNGNRNGEGNVNGFNRGAQPAPANRNTGANAGAGQVNRGGFGNNNNAARPTVENGGRPGAAAPVTRPQTQQEARPQMQQQARPQFQQQSRPQAQQPAARPQAEQPRPATQQARPQSAPREQAPREQAPREQAPRERR